MPRIFHTFVAACLGLLVLVGPGCQSLSSLTQERDALYHQNRALQAKVDQLAAENEALRSAPPPAPAPVAAPAEPAPAFLSLDGTGFQGIGGVEVDTSVANEVTVRVPGDVLFAPGQATLSNASKKTLREVAEALTDNYAGRQVIVEGHTDSDPIRKSNWDSNDELSEARAKAVAAYLAERGVSSTRINTVGLGASEPRGSDKAKNRRVEIVVR
ncbi:MAG: OmpA family protein [Planctomycetota bacterium]